MPGPTGHPPPLLPGVMQVAFHYESAPVLATNVLHFKCAEAAGITEADVTAVATALGTAWINDVWKVQANSSWHVTSYDVLYAHIEGAPDVSRRKLADATAGSDAGNQEFGQVCFLINWSTADHRRGGKPRTYLPGVSANDDADTANLQGGDIAGINAGIVTFLAAVPGISHGNLSVQNLVDYSKVNAGAYRIAGFTWPILSGVCNPVVGTQRRRVDRARA